ncbi:glycoside hydrolase family 88 protein [Saccharicrinis sp. FJH62]|uniref:glycoside hydrolase family 88 protein n=1 Tax=Saccharicrinis sp. FJH62 TaxID=3344657 RepID=UPI0035D4283A
MKRFGTLLCIFLGLIPVLSIAQTLPPASEILSDMELANNYFMAKWPDPGADIVTDKVRPSNLWTRATYYEGLMAMYYVSEDNTLYNYAVDWAESHDWNPTYGNLYTRDGDHQCCGQTYIELYLLDPKPEKIAPITTNIDNMINTTKIDDWSWIDAIQMSMPVFAKLGVVHDDPKYFNRMYEMFSYTKNQHGTNGLYNPEDGLWWRDKDFDPPYTTPDGKACYWSRGNGWVYAALVRVLDVIPETETHYAEYLDVYKDMSAALINCQREDGFWNPSLVDPNDYGGKETSGTGFFVYGLAWGMNKGILDKETYMPSVIKGWNGLHSDALHDNGFLGWVQGTGKQPSDGQPLSYDKEPNFEDFGLGAFLLAGAETYKLAQVTSALNELSAVPFGVNVRNSATGLQIMLQVNHAGDYSMALYDINGRRLKEVITNQNLMAGPQLISLKTDALNSGIYILQTKSADNLVSTKINLVR